MHEQISSSQWSQVISQTSRKNVWVLLPTGVQDQSSLVNFFKPLKVDGYKTLPFTIIEMINKIYSVVVN